MTTKQSTLGPSDQSKSLSKHLAMTVIKPQFKMSIVMRESAFYVYENQGPDQLSGNPTTDQCLIFSYIDNTITLLHESEISNLMLSSMSVQPYLFRS